MWGMIVLKAFLSVMIALVLFYRLWFLRNPRRTVPPGNHIVSPADGTIARIIPLAKGKPFLTVSKGMVGKILTVTGDVAKDGYLLTIVMTPLDVHYQKAPCDCRVMGTKHSSGKFYNAVIGASNLHASFENEHNTILLDTPHGRMKIIQIAGFLCRRIHCFVKPGQRCKKAEDLGIIKLGSQVCLIIPKLKLRIKEGQHVLAGHTVIAEP